MVEAEIIKYAVFGFLMTAFLISYYRLPKNPDKQEYSKTRIFTGAFLTSLTVSSGVKFMYLGFFSDELQKLLGLDDRLFIGLGIAIVTYNAALDLPGYFDLPLIKERIKKRFKQITGQKSKGKNDTGKK
ncbi:MULTISPECIES: hypothetical protein [Aerosakkonema]|uniref:hypothetical protein n=1 Tax=Aerosakkonema TaxID=1246629 RepID=UPI0035B80746